ncbi:MAG: enhanced serine sensitivity protein SseB C-terminal domain-containing protein [Verrucomicrobia bacterium]|nr:enhanced serine sensitivity protein SseB C-terminal domain-containing protein [Verrucomicrobiota bacterium]
MKSPKAQLETILSDPKLGPESHPQLFRLLRENILVFLLPYHPEIMGKFSLANGDPLPKFAVWKGAEGPQIPVFSSIERANEACKKIGVKDGTYALAELNGQQLFHLLSCQTHMVVINPACKIAATCLDINAVKMLADGSILQPIPPGEEKSGQVVIVEPADYPTDFLQPLFRFLRERKEIKAAWLFREADLTPEGQVSYVFVLKSEGNQKQVYQDFNIVAKSACPRTATFGTTPWDANNAPLVAVTSKFPAFYSAPDYKGPSPL